MLADNALTTLEVVKDRLGINDDIRLLELSTWPVIGLSGCVAAPLP
jgi:hypothetical protein